MYVCKYVHTLTVFKRTITSPSLLCEYMKISCYGFNIDFMMLYVCMYVCMIQLTALLTECNVASGELVTSTYRDLLPFLLTSFRDGYHIDQLDQDSVKITKL